VLEYLGFGYKRNYPAFPNTSISTMTTTEVIALQKKLFMLILKALPKKLILSLLPYQTIVTAKRMIWRIRPWQS
ncbi:hypothetical protein AAHH59_10355, partial [Pediococcus acidilactici]|uniref:hypothetical protein n=1 Tax=Pediococcus acidilactici TaxID=1254 RepID=UPI0031962CDC